VIQTGYSQTTTVPTTTNAFGAPIPQYWDRAFITTPIVEPVGNAAGRQTFVGNSGVSFFNPNPKVSKQLRGEISVQRELPGGFMAEAAYVYNYGYNIEITRDINALPNQYLSTDNSRTTAMTNNNTWLSGSLSNPFYQVVPTGTTLNSSTTSRTQLLRAYPEFSGSLNTTNNDGKSWYNSGQFGVQKRFSEGYTLGFTYTLSKWMQATEYLNAGDPKPTKMISDLDSTHRVSISGIFALPFGKGQHFLADAGRVADALIGGWQVQGVYFYQSGFPIVFGTDLFYKGTDPVNGTDIALKGSERTLARAFNTDVFTSILNDTSTNATPVSHLRTLPTRFSAVRADAGHGVNLSVLKNTTLHGGTQLQLRAEFINFLNDVTLATAAQYGVNPTQSAFGQVTATNQANYPRRAQVGIKILF
jgi:hypothetical protein